MIRFIKKKTFNEFYPTVLFLKYHIKLVSHIHVHLNYLFICKYNSLHKFYLIAMHYIVTLYYEIIQLSYF